jgi:hypothetical protein
MNSFHQKATPENLLSIELPSAPEKHITPASYYPFRPTAWDEGKLESYVIKDALPSWANECFLTWMFRGLLRSSDQLVIRYGYHSTGKIVVTPKEGSLDECIARIDPLMTYRGVSVEQKEVTIALFFFRLFDVVQHTEPQKVIRDEN